MHSRQTLLQALQSFLQFNNRTDNLLLQEYSFTRKAWKLSVTHSILSAHINNRKNIPVLIFLKMPTAFSSVCSWMCDFQHLKSKFFATADHFIEACLCVYPCWHTSLVEKLNCWHFFFHLWFWASWEFLIAAASNFFLTIYF